jgi:integrase
MALIEKRARASGKPSYRVRVKYRGRVQSSTHTDRAKAERWAAEIGAKIRDDAHFAGEGNRRRALTDLIDRYVEHVLPGKRNARSQQRHLDWWRAQIGQLPLANVTRAVIAQCRDELLKPHKGKVRGPATVVRYLASLSHVFTVAIGDWEWAEVNPVRGVRKPQEPRGRDRYLQDDEREGLLAACKASKSPDLYPAVLLALCTGMRRGEVLHLEWRDIDFPRRHITLRQTKNGARRSVPLVSPAFEVFEARSKVRRLDTPLVFPGMKNPRKPKDAIRPKDLTKPWETARQKAGLVDFRFHDLRHSAASYLAMSGASTLEIAAILGHKTLQMTKRYSHLSTEHLRSVLERSNEGVRRHA